MPTKDNNIIKYNQGEKFITMPFIIYADLECLLEKMSTCQNNPNKSSTTKINKHTPSGYSLFAHCSFDESKNKLNYYRGEVTHYLLIVHLMNQKINLIIIEEMIV